MPTVGDIVRVMECLAPPELCEPWDNTGLLLGDPDDRVSRLMTCLTLTPESVHEAIERAANMVIAHHPLPFKPLSKITTESNTGKLLWELAKSGISVYSPHTCWDSAAGGINFQLASRLELSNIEPLVPSVANLTSPYGAGRFGRLAEPQPLVAIARRIARQVPHCRLRGVDSSREIQSIAVACGSGGSFVSAAAQKDCQLLVTGEATFHNCLEAKAMGISLLMLGHFASEKFAMAKLAEDLLKKIPSVDVWTSQRETDPVVGMS